MVLRTDLDKTIIVEVCYARPQKQALLRVTLPHSATVAQAIAASNILTAFPEIDLVKNKVGIFGRLAKLDEFLCEGDRIEIYRPLLVDPKDARRKRAAGNKATK